MEGKLSTKQKIQILILKGCDGMIRTFSEIINIFNNKYPNAVPVMKSGIYKILKILGNLEMSKVVFCPKK